MAKGQREVEKRNDNFIPENGVLSAKNAYFGSVNS